MAEYLIKDTTLTEIADAIRSKTGGTESIPVCDMASTIEGIRIPVEESTTIELDFSDGDMIIEPGENTVFDKVIIPKPANLTSENISKDTVIAGIKGNLVSGGGGNLEGDLLDYVVYQLDNENKEIVIYGILWSQLYAATGSYDLNIPDTLGAYQVVIASEGVK